MKKAMVMLFRIITVVFFLFAVLLSFSAIWLLETWPNLKIGELVFQLSRGFSGTGGNYVETYIRSCVLPTVILGLILLAGIYLVRNMRKSILWIEMILTSFLAIAITVSFVYQRLDAGEYITYRSSDSEFIYDNYADPAKTAMVFPEKKRNLIYIYLESIEITFADQASGGAFEFNCISELTEIAKEYEDFSGNRGIINGAYSMPDTTWTMAAIFAESTGLPLQTSVDANQMDRQDAFFPGIISIGDILAQQGYHNEYLIGSDAAFAGRDLFFTSHGKYDIHDYDYAVDNGLIPEDYYEWWGYEDEKLFDYAKQDLEKLSAAGEPFNLTILTVDTHFEDGYVCDDCEEEFGDNQYANVMACSSRRVSSFISWCREQAWFENTTIVLSGDHPTMDVDFCKDVAKDYRRRVYTAFINPAIPNAAPDKYREYCTFDHFPTTLAALGVFIEGDRLGLGTNLFSGKETLTETLGYQQETAELKQRSKFMERMSGIVIHARDYEERGDKLRSGNVQATLYDTEKEELHLKISDITAGNGDVHKVLIRTAGPSGEKYTAAVPESDGSFSAILKIPADQLDQTLLKVCATTDEDGKLEGSTIFEYSDENLLFISSVQKDAAGFLEMVKNLDPERYTVFMSTKGNASRCITDEIQNALFALGASTDLRNAGDISYFFVKDKEGLLEKSSDSYLEYRGYTADWFPFNIVSAGEGSGNISAIMIGDGFGALDDCSPDENGMNFVIWDNQEREDVCTASFDTTRPAASAEVKAGKPDPETSRIALEVSGIQNTGSVRKVSAVLSDKDHPGRSHSAGLTQNEDEIWTALIDTSGINIENSHLKIIITDSSGTSYILHIHDGNLNDYQALHPAEVMSEADETDGN